ncbi:hypothetical protein [Niabella hibiscisoli]|uniref:hypothetical protein n=1 Tax=Niabella hibiscisoli TaxID=1825928 RepID=UPI001F0E5168|nr:hypothetical protein [Niabella hibiscisoli]MCH5719925.1 hypothetical protein [Niabella hibiscisoli]
MKTETGKVPENLATSFGIKYTKLAHTQDFTVSYSRGFTVTEKYESHLQNWRSYGWND